MKANKNIYYRQAELMLHVLPFVMKCDCFALKGGSAINFFLRDLPRLSIDIDLTYLPIEKRETTIEHIDNSLKQISEMVSRNFRRIKVFPRKLSDSNFWNGIILQLDDASVKIEPNLIIRGTVFPCETRKLTTIAEKNFEMSMKVQMLSLADLYGGKICAALDRQHPRDLFDIKLLFENEGLIEPIRKAFIVYLISHNRPIHELLNPNKVDIKHIFDNEFQGMTNIPVAFDELAAIREQLIFKIKKALTLEEKEFLLSIKKREPDWHLLGIEGIEKLPAVQWKLINLARMPKNRYQKALTQLESILAL